MAAGLICGRVWRCEDDTSAPLMFGNPADTDASFGSPFGAHSEIMPFETRGVFLYLPIRLLMLLLPCDRLIAAPLFWLWLANILISLLPPAEKSICDAPGSVPDNGRTKGWPVFHPISADQ